MSARIVLLAGAQPVMCIITTKLCCLVMLSCADAQLNRYTDPWRAHHYVSPRSSLGHRLRPMSSQLRVRVRILMRICARDQINEWTPK